MKNNNSPGSDGLTKEFYEYSWDLIGDEVVNMLNDAYSKETPPRSLKGYPYTTK